MNENRQVAEAKALRQAEEAYRKRLLREPTDVEARLRLAWCLFLLSLHQAGREAIVQELLATGSEAGVTLTDRLQTLLHQDSEELLRDCLRQLSAVTRLSDRVQDQRDAEQLGALVRLSGGEQAACEVEAEAINTLADLARELRTQKPFRASRLRRRPSQDR